jgi:glutathionylspermidine synthase
MNGPVLARIPADYYSEYRYEAIFRAYKWDPQVEDHNTVADHAVLLDRATARQLEEWAEKLTDETLRMEESIKGRPELIKKLGFPRAVEKAIGRMDHYDPAKHVRLMRFDFHPTTEGWAVSEVNSDVPGGLAEASVLPAIAQRCFPGYIPHENTARHLLEAFQKRVEPGARIAFVHCTSYADDRQVMQFLGDYFEENGYRSLYAAPDHIVWEQKRAVSLIRGETGPVDGIVRFFPLEWLANLPRRSDWGGYYDTLTPSCNHPISVFAQSKRLPLVWDSLGTKLTAWKALLPETCAPNLCGPGEGWIYKPALGRVGEGISIREALTAKEYAQIQKTVRRNPKDWIAQKRFESKPILSADGEPYHLCIGVFTVDGRAAGFYGRVSPYPRIDARAKDIPLLVEEKR